MALKVMGLAIVACGLALSTNVLVAQEKGAEPGQKSVPALSDSTKLKDPNAIEAALKGNDNFQVQLAVGAVIDVMTDEKAAKNTTQRLPAWLHILNSEKRFDEIENIAVEIINARPFDLIMVEACQEARIRAKLSANKPKEGLALAKGLYNVCAMPDTSKAIDLIGECLYDINIDNDPATAVKQFKLQQIHDAATTRPSIAADENILNKIVVDSKCYDNGIQHVDQVDDSWQGLLGRGNLLLLSDKPKDAQKVFDKAYALASDKNLAVATEAVARTMRAEDSAVGRANAWILSLRPSDNAGQ